MKNITKKITLKSVDEKVETTRQEMQEGFRGVKVLLEDMSKKWDLVAEQYLGVTNGLDIVAREVAIVKEQVQLININLAVGLPRRGKGLAS